MTTKKDIENALMRGADTLRDTIDAANYKDYVLPIMFVKYLSDSYEDALDELKKEYDYIIIDGTPLCLVSDMLVLSPYIDGYVIVVRAEMTNKKILNKSVSMIKKINGKVLGFVLSRKKQKKSERYYYGEYGSSKYL